jgi:heptosyltransferase-2
LDLSKAKKLLIIRLSSLGDILLATPVIRALKNTYPEMQIDFLCKKSYKDLLVNNPYIKNIYTFEKKGKKREELIARLVKEEYDLTADLQNNFRSRRINLKIPSGKIRFRKKSLLKFLLVNFKINLLKKAPQIPVRYAGIFKNLLLDDKGLDLISNKKSLLDSSSRYIGIAPGSRHFTKMWPKEYYIELCKLLRSAGFKIAVFGGRNDIDSCCEISSEVDDSLNLCNSDNILQTVADMKECQAVVCNDSGLMHAACAAGVPVLAFFGSTVKEFGFFPYKNRNIVLENHGLSCRPCTHIGRESCPRTHFKCMLELTPQTAFQQLNYLLNS